MPCTLHLGKDMHMYAEDQTNIKGKAFPKTSMQIKKLDVKQVLLPT